jgi:hypothetical protein
MNARRAAISSKNVFCMLSVMEASSATGIERIIGTCLAAQVISEAIAPVALAILFSTRRKRLPVSVRQGMTCPILHHG